MRMRIMIFFGVLFFQIISLNAFENKEIKVENNEKILFRIELLKNPDDVGVHFICKFRNISEKEINLAPIMSTSLDLYLSRDNNYRKSYQRILLFEAAEKNSIINIKPNSEVAIKYTFSRKRYSFPDSGKYSAYLEYQNMGDEFFGIKLYKVKIKSNVVQLEI